MRETDLYEPIKRFLEQQGYEVKAEIGSGVAHARRIMADNHYGWFQRVGTGIYDLTPEYNLRLDDRAGNCPAG